MKENEKIYFILFICDQVTECDAVGQTPLHIAALHGHDVLVSTLLGEQVQGEPGGTRIVNNS